MRGSPSAEPSRTSAPLPGLARAIGLGQSASHVELEAGPLPFRVDLVEREGLWPGMAERVLSEAVPL